LTGFSTRKVHYTLWQRLLELPDQPSWPLQARLRAALVREIDSGRLAAGSALPSSRDLAKLLGMGRTTVIAVYEQLIDDGFLKSRPRSGIFVDIAARGLRAEVPGPSRSAGNVATDWTVQMRRSVVGRPTLTKPDQWRDCPFPFIYGRHDPQLFPVEDFRECCVRTLARANLEHWTPDFETDDVPDLVEQLRLQVLPRRGVFALPEEILVTVGAQQAFHLLAEGLMDAQTRVGLEDPGYPHARNCFSLRTPRMLPFPVDEQGLVVSDVADIDYLFVTPTQQSPTTVTMSLARRENLLHRAEHQNFFIVEDDYEADNLHDGLPLPALKSLDRNGRVIYVGSIAKSLAPAVRLGYIVAPRALVAELRMLRHVAVRHPSAFLQHAYATYLSMGHQESHARRVNQAMRDRVAAASQALSRSLPDFHFRMPQGGASIWVRAPDWLDASELALEARRRGVLIEPGDVFFLEPPYPCPYFRLRLSSIVPARIGPGIEALADAVHALGRARGVLRSQ
jgi:GntR family transcriptional regulator/MocR family aminotransferase